MFADELSALDKRYGLDRGALSYRLVRGLKTESSDEKPPSRSRTNGRLKYTTERPAEGKRQAKH